MKTKNELSKKKDLNDKIDFSKEDLKSLYNNLLIGIYRSTPDGKIIYANKVLVDMLGFDSLEEIQKQNIESKIFNSVDSRKRFKEQFADKDEIKGYEAYLVKKDGSHLFVRENAKAIRNEKGEIIYYDGIVEDISKDKRYDFQAAEINEHYNQFMEDDITADFISTAEGKLLICNTAFVKMFGFASKEEAMKCDLSELYVSKEHRESLLNHIKEFKRVEAYEIEMIKRNGNKFFVLANLIGQFDRNGKLKFLKGYLFDISKRKRVEKQVADLTKVYSLLSGINQSIVRLKDKKTLFDAVCRIIVEEGGYKAAAIYQFNEEQKSVKLSTSFNADQSHLNEVTKLFAAYPGNIKVLLNELSENGCLLLKDIENDEFFKELQKINFNQGFRSAVFLPVKQDGNIKWVLKIFSESVKAFTDKEISLFKELSIDITFAVEYYANEKHRKKVIEELKKSEKRNRQIVEEAVEVIFTTDMKGNFTYANPAALKASGYSLPELLKMNYLDLILPEYKRRVFVHYNRQFADGKHVTYTEFPFYSKSGEAKWFGQNTTLLTDGDKLRGFYVIARDITERRKFEEALLLSEEKYKRLAENADDLIYRYDLKPSGRFAYVSPSVNRITGYTPEEHYADPELGLKIIHPEDKEKLEKLFKDNSFFRKPVTLRWIHKNGKVVWTEQKNVPVIDKFNKLIAIEGIARDITDRKYAEEELIKLKRAIEQSSASVVITDKNGNIEYINPYFTKITGYNFEEVKGNTPRILKSGYHNNEFYEQLWSTILSGREWQGEIFNKKKNGEYYWANAVISPIIMNGSGITHFVAIEEDITEKKKIMEELIKAKEKAEEINRIKTSFFANMSHELRTPFVGILGYSELLMECLKNPEEKEMAEGIFNSSKRLMETLDKILTVTKLESDKNELYFTDVDVECVINEINADFAKTALRKNLYLNVVHKSGSLSVRTNEHIFREILIYLVRNAINYTFEGLVEITSERTSVNKEKRIIISVRDTGIGIPADKQELVWEEFRQVSEGLNRSFEGTGLGLSIVKRYTELLGGKISLQSEVGIGSVFTVDLPDVEVVDSSSKHESAAQTVKTKAKPSKISEPEKKKLLYVDDDIHSRQVLLKSLSELYHIDLAEEADSALEKVKLSKYDAVLVDINLSRGINGVELTQLIKKMPGNENLPIIAVTAFASEKDRKEFLAKGMTHYISKPFILDDLKKLLESVFRK